MKDRETKVVRHVSQTDASAIQGLVREHPARVVIFHKDLTRAGTGMPEFTNETIDHSAREHVREMGHTNGMGALFWTVGKSGYPKTSSRIRAQCIDRDTGDVSGCHNVRDHRALAQLGGVACGTVGRSLHHRDLVAANNVSSGAGPAA